MCKHVTNQGICYARTYYTTVVTCRNVAFSFRRSIPANSRVLSLDCSYQLVNTGTLYTSTSEPRGELGQSVVPTHNISCLVSSRKSDAPFINRVFENKVLREIFGAKSDDATGEWRKLHNAELHALYSSPDIIRNIKSRRLRWAGHVARMGESRNAYRVLIGKPEGKRPCGGRDVDGRRIATDPLMVEVIIFGMMSWIPNVLIVFTVDRGMVPLAPIIKPCTSQVPSI
ncbi:hypothetical protein ANN_12985 [Periplaneta americana]|uniref:Uncharacterized protein n=1 Tax=Periplaneta americana TaxID=6978 RepID=A0ABQ8TIA4_PERAM|nr:hypothetical protein ANN_12985 [Periplaneta americana]